MLAALVGPLQSIPEVATSDRFSEMLKFFGIAAVLVIPACVVVWRRAKERAGASLRADEPEPEPEPELPPDPFEVGTIVAAVDAAARSLAPGDVATIDVPPSLTLDGSPAPTGIAETLIADAIARNSVRASWATGDDGWRVVTLSR